MNTVSNILSVIMAQALIVLREQCVMPRLVNTDFQNVPAGQGDSVNVVISSALPVTDVSPSKDQPTPESSTPVKVAVPLDQWRKTGHYLTDKERGELGSGRLLQGPQEAAKALANDINSFIFQQYKRVYGFAGTPGTTPFATDLTGAKELRTVLNQQLVPVRDRRLVLDPLAEANAMHLAQFLAADQRGDQGGVLDGQIGRKLGMDWYLDQAVPTHDSTALTAGAATVNGAQAVGVGSTDNGRTGTLSIAKATNASDLVKGDVITIAGDDQTYVVLADVTLAVGNTSVSIAPALKVATAGGEAVTLKASHVVNLGFHRDAFTFASRRLQSETPGVNQFTVADPVSQVVLRVELIRQNKQDYVEYDVLYGAICSRPELAARLAG
jgi:hypothetical protein